MDAIESVLSCQGELNRRILEFNQLHSENVQTVEFGCLSVSFVQDFTALKDSIRNTSSIHTNFIKEIIELEKRFLETLSKLQIHLLFAAFTDYSAQCQRSIRLFTSTCVSSVVSQFLISYFSYFTILYYNQVDRKTTPPTVKEYLKSVDEVKDIFTSDYVATYVKVAFNILVLKETMCAKQFSIDIMKKLVTGAPLIDDFARIIKVQFENVSAFNVPII